MFPFTETTLSMTGRVGRVEVTLDNAVLKLEVYSNVIYDRLGRRG
jgi:hypothetical protein